MTFLHIHELLITLRRKCQYRGGIVVNWLAQRWKMPDCQIEYVSSDSDQGIPCGKPAVAKCADCGASICSDCQLECCGDSFCELCYDCHATNSGVKRSEEHTSELQSRVD